MVKLVSKLKMNKVSRLVTKGTVGYTSKTQSMTHEDNAFDLVLHKLY